MSQFLNINEIFYSIDGEGKRVGKLVGFIRLTGCNLRCSYCDTLYAMNEGKLMAIESIANKVFLYKNITITGGEPLMQDLHGLLKLLKNHSINIETNGSIDISDYLDYDNVFFTIDYKTPSSMMNDRMIEKNFKLLRPRDVLKFVVSNIEDLDAAQEFYNEVKPECNVFISPVYNRILPESIVEYMKDNFLENWRLQLQLHKIIWRPEERGV